jgi:NADH-quinone oxidoreductase subunit N
MLLGLIVFSDAGLNALWYYLLVYSISNIAIFFLLEYWEVHYKITQVSELVGIGKKSPWSSSMMIVLLASFTGLPPLAGFVAKFFVFGSIFQQFQLSQSPWLLFALIAGVVNTVIALFYYFNIARYLFLKKSTVSASEEVYSLLLPFISILTLNILTNVEM